jgi:hypothetical protein
MKNKMNTVSDLDKYMLLSSLDNADKVSEVWQEDYKFSVMLHPEVLTSDDFLEYGWPFLTFCSIGKLKLVLSEALLRQYLKAITESHEKSPTLFSTFALCLERCTTIHANISFDEITKSDSRCEALLSQVLLLHDGENTRVFSDVYKSESFASFMANLTTSMPVEFIKQEEKS